MTLPRGNPSLNIEEMQSLISRIQEEYQATNVVFIEQTNHHYIFKGYSGGKKYNYYYDKSIDAIKFDEIV